MNDSFTDYFELLGITPDADNDDINRAYRRRIKEIHPDKHDNGDAAVEQAKLLNEARDTLKDADRRRAYRGRWLLHRLVQQRSATTTASPKASPYARPRPRRPAPPETPTVRMKQRTSSPSPPSPRSASGGLGALGFVGLLLGGAYILSKKNTNDRNLGRYRGRDGTFRSGRFA